MFPFKVQLRSTGISLFENLGLLERVFIKYLFDII